MRLPSGTTDQYIYFIAVDATDFTTRETGLSSFTVYRSRDGAAAAAMTTPTINEVDATNMPGVYELLLDEDTTIAAGNDSEEMVFHITHTGMSPVTRVIEIYRPKITVGNTLSVESDGDLTEVNTLTGHTAQTGDNYARLGAPAGASVSADIATIDTELATVDSNVDAILVDTGTTLPATLSTIDSNVDAILVDTGTTLPATLATIDTNVDSVLADTGTDGVAISSTVANQVADALLNRDMSAVSDTNSRSPLNALRFLRNKWSVSGSALTVTKEDDSTSAWTSTLTSDAAADPVTGSDPA